MINTYNITLTDDSETFTLSVESDNYQLVGDYFSGKVSDEDLINLCDIDGEYLIKDIELVTY